MAFADVLSIINTIIW